MWNALLPMLDASYNRKKLIEPMSKVHELLMSAKENSDPDFLVLFYHGLFTCISEQKEWKLGEKVVDEAFNYVPQTHQKVLWEAKALYLSKLGKNVLNAISNMKEGDATLQAKVWVKLAKIFSEPVEQHMAFNKAIELMTKEESVEVVEVLIDYAEWLHRNEYPTLDVEDQLLLAVDVLLDLEPGWDEGEEDTPEEEKTKTKSRKSKGSRASRVSKAKSKMSKVSRKTGKTAKKSMAGRSGMSRASRRTALSKTTTRTKKTKTALSRRENEDPQPLFLNVSHYDKLFRIHSMLSYLSYEQKEIALDAQFFVVKMWEQSYKTLNAFEFLDKHRDQAEKLGFNDQDPDARANFYNEVFTNPDVELPSLFSFPESPEGWIDFEPQEEFIQLSKKHEDKTMIAKWAFQKPEITLYHIGHILDLLESHYLHIQMIPILKFGKLFCSLVIENQYFSNLFDLKLVRITYNFGIVDKNINLAKKMQDLALTEAIKQKLLQENSTGGTEPKPDLKAKEVNFPETDKKDVFGIEKVKTHEVWKEAAKECIKFGNYLQAKDLIMESMLHSRILKEQNNYAECFNVLSLIAELEGQTNSSIKLDMYCQSYAKDLQLICKSISTALRHLVNADKPEASILMERSLDLFRSMKSKVEDKIIIPELWYSMQHVYLDYAHWCIVQLDQGEKDIKTRIAKLSEATIYLDDYETLVHQAGTRIGHIIKCLEISKLLYSCLDKSNSFDDTSLSHIESRLERGAKLLLRAQEHLTSQVSLLPTTSNTYGFKAVSHPLKRLLGIVKLRLAQANSEIGVFRSMMKTQFAAEGNSKKSSQAVEQWMEVISKQIDAQNKTVRVSLSIYEKSIILLNNAMNLLDPKCEEYLECIVEVAKCKRLLAVNKKHLRAVWRQDAEEINNALDQTLIDDSKLPDDDFEDVNANYKEEALRSFVEILSNPELMKRIINTNTNLLATLALEYAECKGNLNKEQCFASLALYQFAISRKELKSCYFKACDSHHPDILRRLQVERSKDEFKAYSTPEYPQSILENEKKLREESNALKNINASFNYTDEIKPILPHSSAYLILQFSSNMQQLYVGFAKINKEHKFEYYLTKLTLSDAIIEDLEQIKAKMVSLRSYMYKTPITIQEDLDIIEREAEEELHSIIEHTEDFLRPVFTQLNEFINPEIPEKEGEVEDEAAAAAAAGAGKKGKEPPKADPKKGAKDELAKYESNLPLPTSGIESMVLLLDSRLSGLPVEACEIFKKIPVMTRDFNLHMYTNRLTNLGHKAELHNNQGIAKDSMTYIYDPPSSIQDKFKAEVIDEHTKLIPGSQWTGVDTKHHIPSDGEWQRLLRKSSLFTYFSMTCVLHVYPPEKIAETTSIARANAAVILDRMNSYKPLIEKDVLTSKHFKEKDQPDQTAALFSVLGMNSILINQWAISPEENMRIYRDILNEIGVKGKYIGAAIQR